MSNQTKRERQKTEAARLQSRISGEWKDFSRTYAYKQLMEYIDLQDYMAITGAKGPINTFDTDDGSQVSFDGQKAAALLQRSVGYDIVRLYVKGYVENTTNLASQ